MADYGFFTPQTATRILTRLASLESAVFGGGAGVVPQLGQSQIYVHNTTAEEIPAYGCMQCTGTEVIGNRTYVQVSKPADSTGGAGGFLFNSSRAIPANGNGIGFAGPHVRALGNGSTATAGDKWAPVSSSWEIAPDSAGFLICVGDDEVATDVIRVISVAGSGGGFPLIHCVTPEAGIPARNGSDVMGSASCDVYDSNTSGALTDSATNLTIYNPSRTAIAGSTHIAAVQNQAGIWVAIFEDCGVVE